LKCLEFGKFLTVLERFAVRTYRKISNISIPSLKICKTPSGKSAKWLNVSFELMSGLPVQSSDVLFGALKISITPIV